MNKHLKITLIIVTSLIGLVIIFALVILLFGNVQVSGPGSDKYILADSLKPRAHQLYIKPITSDQYLDLVKSYKGNNVVTIFWASWCKPCHERIEQFSRLKKSSKTPEFKLVIVSGDINRSGQIDIDKEHLYKLNVTDTTYIMDYSLTLDPTNRSNYIEFLKTTFGISDDNVQLPFIAFHDQNGALIKNPAESEFLKSLFSDSLKAAKVRAGGFR